MKIHLDYKFPAGVPFHFFFWPCLKFLVKTHLIDEMIETVDRNGDGKISFSEFR